MDTRESVNGVRPSLGLAWADVVTVRLMLTRDEAVESNGDEVQTVRGHIIQSCIWKLTRERKNGRNP